MPNESHYCVTTSLKNNSVAQILQKLQTLTGLVYLADNAQPVVAFCPEFYILLELSQPILFSQISWNRYHQQAAVDKKLSDYFPFQPTNKSAKKNLEIAHLEPDFMGGYIGFIGYDYAAQHSVDVTLAAQPALFLGYYSHFLKQIDDEWVFYSHSPHALNVYAQLEQLFNQPPALPKFKHLKPIQAVWEKPQYDAAIERVQDYIRAGDCYQINLTQAFCGEAEGALLDCADALWSLTKAPYAGYLKINDFELLSCSPELFLQFSAHRQLKTRPIKGTRPRAKCTEQDLQAAQELLASSKDQAENLMIVDLLRNDLSVYAEIGSVKTPKLFEIESFQQVHHLVSEVVATLNTNSHPLEVLLNALPGGSITGAPKKRAMQIIQELEVAPRGAYCGSLGYFNMDGTGRWNILIRTVQKMQNQVSVWAGGGITIASDADAEYQECLDKVSAIIDLLNQWPQQDSSSKHQSHQ